MDLSLGVYRLAVYVWEVHNLERPISDLGTHSPESLQSESLQLGSLPSEGPQSRSIDFGSGDPLAWESTV